MKTMLSALAALLCVGCVTEPPVTGTTAAGIHYEVAGRGPTVVLLHGFSLDGRMWDREFDLLRPDFRVVRYDLRGHGQSAPWTEPFSAEDDLESVLDAVGADRAVLVGLSAGAQVAIDFALARPDRVAALVLASPGLGGYQPLGSFEWMEPVMSALREGEPRQAMRAWAETPLMRIASDPRADSVMRAITRDNWAIWTFDPGLQIQPDPAAITRLREIGSPTLVVVGERDQLDTWNVADTLMACVPRVLRVEIEGAGHLVNLEAPDAFGRALRDFLSSNPAETLPSGPGC